MRYWRWRPGTWSTARRWPPAPRERSLAGGRREAFRELTQGERAVLELLASGARNGRIKAELGITDKSVRNQISAILWKLQVSDRTAARKARDRVISGQSKAGG